MTYSARKEEEEEGPAEAPLLDRGAGAGGEALHYAALAVQERELPLRLPA